MDKIMDNIDPRDPGLSLQASYQKRRGSWCDG